MPILGELLRGGHVWAKGVRFAIAGGINTVLYGILTWALVRFLGSPPLFATILGYLAVLPASFLLQKLFTFRSEAPSMSEAPRFALVHGANLAVSALGMHIIVDLLHADYRLGILMTMALVPVATFVAMHLWVFAARPTGFAPASGERQRFDLHADRWLLALAALHLLLKVALASTMLHVAPSGDELAYLDAAKALSNAVRDLVRMMPPDTAELSSNVVANGWFMPGMPLLLTPLYLFLPKAGIAAVRIYMGFVSLAMLGWAVLTLRRQLGWRFALPLLVFPSLAPLWVMFSFTLWGDLYAGLLLVVLLVRMHAVATGLREGRIPGAAQAMALGALAVAVLYLRSSALPLIPLFFGALLLASLWWVRGRRRWQAISRVALGLACCGVLLLPWSLAASSALRGPVLTTTSVPLSLGITFGETSRLCFGRCEPGNIWLKAVGYSRAVAAETGRSEMDVQRSMARYALAGVDAHRYARLALGDFGRYLFKPAEFVARFVRGKSTEATRRWISAGTRTFYWIGMAAWLGGLVIVVRRSGARQIASILVKIASLGMLLQPLLHVSHGRYWPAFAPLAALSAGVLLDDLRGAEEDDAASSSSLALTRLQYLIVALAGMGGLLLFRLAAAT